MSTDLKTELQALLQAFREENTGNDPDPDHALIQGAMEFMQLFETESDAKMRLFNEAMMAISGEYPDGKDDNRRQLLLLTAIREIDPDHSEQQLQDIAAYIEQNAGPVEQEAPAAAVQEKADIPVALLAGQAGQIRQLISGRQLLWMKVVSPSSDSLQIQLLEDGSLYLLQQWSSYAPEVGRVAGQKDLDGTWKIIEKNGAAFLVLDGSDGSSEELEIVVKASNAVLLGGREFGIVEIDRQVSL
jgi:hypothetical protein